MALLYPLPPSDILSFGTLSTYKAGTTIPLSTFKDKEETQPHPNVIPLSEYGTIEGGVWLEEGENYLFIFKNQKGEVIQTIDGVSIGVDERQQIILHKDLELNGNKITSTIDNPHITLQPQGKTIIHNVDLLGEGVFSGPVEFIGNEFTLSTDNVNIRSSESSGVTINEYGIYVGKAPGVPGAVPIVGVGDPDLPLSKPGRSDILPLESSIVNTLSNYSTMGPKPFVLPPVQEFRFTSDSDPGYVYAGLRVTLPTEIRTKSFYISLGEVWVNNTDDAEIYAYTSSIGEMYPKLYRYNNTSTPVVRSVSTSGRVIKLSNAVTPGWGTAFSASRPALAGTNNQESCIEASYMGFGNTGFRNSVGLTILTTFSGDFGLCYRIPSAQSASAVIGYRGVQYGYIKGEFTDVLG